jgi:DNA-directed RNA polymerase specialized sigma24 family protein
VKENFESVYRRFIPVIRRISKRYAAHVSGQTFEDYVSHLSETLWRCYQKYSTAGAAKFETYVNRAFHNKITDIRRNKGTGFFGQALVADKKCSDDEDAATFEIADTYRFEDFLLKKKALDQRQLIELLTDPNEVDALTTAIVKVFEKFGDDYTALGKAHGVSRDTARRRIQSLARRYDSRIHGEIIDYFPDGVRIRREFVSA